MKLQDKWIIHFKLFTQIPCGIKDWPAQAKNFNFYGNKHPPF